MRDRPFSVARTCRAEARRYEPNDELSLHTGETPRLAQIVMLSFLC